LSTFRRPNPENIRCRGGLVMIRYQ
jgi:hypothetical protein